MSRSVALLVLGMHRSGTSAITRVINLLGVSLGSKLKAPADDNPSGFWEHEQVVAIHEGLLQSFGMAWDDPRPLPTGWLDLPATAIAAKSIADIIERDFATLSSWAVKDPRLCRLVPLWRRVLTPLGVESRAVIVARNPLEVAKSLSTRNDIPDAVGQLLWARHMQEAELGSRGLRRCLIDYESLLADWPGVIARMGEELDLDLDVATEAKLGIDSFLSTTLRHHQQSNDSVKGFIGPLAKVLHDHVSSESTLSQLARTAATLEAELQPYLPIIGGLSKMLAAERERLASKEEEIESTAVALAQATAWGSSRNAELAKTVKYSERLRTELEKSTAWGASRDAELRKLLERAEMLREELEKSTAWGASRDHELRKTAATLDSVWKEREQLNSELHKRHQDLERMQDQVSTAIAELQTQSESTRIALRRKQDEVDGLQNQTNLLGARIAALEYRVYTAGAWNALRRTLSRLYAAARRGVKSAVIRGAVLWPGTPERKQARLSLLHILNQGRITGVNGASVLRDLGELAEDRWPARPAYRLRGSALAEPPNLDISVVLYDSERWVDGFMSSLYAIDYPLERLHLYVRDHSDGHATRETFERFIAERGCPLGTCTFSSGRNAGYGAGHNHNFRLGRSDFFLVTNIDGRFREDTLRSVCQAATTSNDAVAAWELRQAPYEHPKYYDPVTMFTSWVSGACVLFRRSAYRLVNGFDDRIFMYGEDVDLSYRLRGAGFRLAYAAGAVYEHDSYAEPQQVKPLQFHGSSLANILLRLRFGTLADILAIPRMWRELGRSARQLGLYRGFLRNSARLALVGPVFALSRLRRRNARIPFVRWDYGLRREGAFESVASGQQARPLVSIIVRTYRDRADLLRQALASIANQSYPHIQAIVVEDKGAAMREVAESCALAYGLDISYLSCESSDSNRCNTGNIGLAAASGEYVNFLDDDDLFFADHIEYLVSRLSERPDLGACYALAWEAQVAIDPATGRYQEVLHSSRPDQQREFDRALLQTANYMPIQTVLFRRALFERYGGFNPRLENLEDWDLWRRYSWRNDFLMCPKTTSLYHVPADIDRKIARQAMLDQYYPIAKRESDAACLAITVV